MTTSATIRWPYQVSSGSQTIRFAGNATTSDQTFSTSTTYIAKGETGTGTPTDIVDAFETMCNAAITALFGSGSITVTLETDGRLELTRTGGGIMSIEWTDAATTFEGEVLGFNNASNFIISGVATKAPYQVYGAWYAGEPHERLSAEMPVDFIAEVADTLGGRIFRNRHNSAPFYRKLVEWRFVPAARILEDRISDSAYSTYAGVVQSDPNAPLEVLKEYLLGATARSGITFPESGSVYVYTTNDPATHAESGPYQVVLSELLHDIADAGMGWSMDRAQEDCSSEVYPVRMILHKEA